jgi:PAS domain S-box-containing protein
MNHGDKLLVTKTKLEAQIAELEAALEKAETIEQISRGLNTADSEDKLLRILAQSALEAGLAGAILLYIDPDEAGEPEWSEVVALWQREGVPAVAVGNRYYLPQFPCAKLWMTSPDRPLLIQDVAKGKMDEQLKNLLIQIGASAIALIPLAQAGRWVGFVIFIWDQPHEFSHREVEIYHTLIGLASPAVESQRLVKEAHTRLRDLAVLNELGQELTTRLSEKSVLEEIYRQASRLIDTSNLYIALYDPDANEVSLAIEVIEGRLTKPYATWRNKQGFPEYVIHNRTSVIAQDTYADWADEKWGGVYERASLAELGVRVPLSVLGVPLVVGDQVLGMVAVRDFVNPRAYDEHDREMLTAIANQTAIALQNARLFDNLERMVAERTAELQETEMRLSQFVERSLTGIYRTTLDGEIIEANPAMLEMLGYDSVEETNQIGLSNLYVDPAQYEEMSRLIREEGQVTGFEMAMRRKDGESVQLAATAQLVMNEGGKPAFLEGTIENITRRKQLEAEREQLQQEIIEVQKQALRELNTALQTMNRGIVFLDPEGRITHINARAGDILGISHRLAKGRRFSTLIGLPIGMEAAMAQRTSMAEKEVVFQAADGPRPCLMSMNVLEGSSLLPGFILTLGHAAEARRLAHHIVGARAHFTYDDVIGQDVEMQRVMHYARTIAQSDSTVLILGESGTGKEMFAQAIHNGSRRAEGPFVAINCAAIPRELMASELFGYEGAFAVGEEGRPGKFELADGGTIFFDNVDGMPLDMQASLLRVIDTREVVRLGGTGAILLNVRVIAASNNVDLANEVQRGRFRADLFYRLNVLTLTIPPLRDRGNDILLMIAHLTEKFGRRLKKTVTVSPEAMAVLQSYHWPGNIRELENVLERAVHMVDGSELALEHLPVELRTATIGGTDEVLLTLQEAERQAIIRVGRVLRGNTTKMAEALGIGRTTLWRKMKTFNLSANSFKGLTGAALRR